METPPIIRDQETKLATALTWVVTSDALRALIRNILGRELDPTHPFDVKAYLENVVGNVDYVFKKHRLRHRRPDVDRPVYVGLRPMMDVRWIRTTAFDRNDPSLRLQEIDLTCVTLEDTPLILYYYRVKRDRFSWSAVSCKTGENVSYG